MWCAPGVQFFRHRISAPLRSADIAVACFTRQHRRHAGGSFDSTITAGDKEAEFVYGVEVLRDIRSDALFGNVYRDYPDAFGGLTPYVGAGVGLLGIGMAYGSAYHRNPDRDVMRGLGRHPAAARTLSAQDADLSDRLWGIQFIAGLERPLAGGHVLGLKARHVTLEGRLHRRRPAGRASKQGAHGGSRRSTGDQHHRHRRPRVQGDFARAEMLFLSAIQGLRNNVPLWRPRSGLAAVQVEVGTAQAGMPEPGGACLCLRRTVLVRIQGMDRVSG